MSAAVDEGHRYFTPEIARVLERTPLKRWPAFAVLLDSETHDTRLMLRGALAALLRANDLGALAHEAMSRRVAEGEMLALVLGRERTYFRVMREPPDTVAPAPEAKP